MEDDQNRIAFHIGIFGHAQRTSDDSGIAFIMDALTGEDSGDCYYCNSHSRVDSYPWNTRWVDVADKIARETRKKKPLVAIYAYSWGAGNGFVRLSKLLRQRGIDVECAVLCDPVYRAPWIPDVAFGVLDKYMKYPLYLRSMFGRDWPLAPVIRIPPNVKAVWPFRQTMNLPQGHRLVWDKKRTRMHEEVVLERIHQRMDEAPAFKLRALEVAAEIDRKVNWRCKYSTEGEKACMPS